MLWILQHALKLGQIRILMYWWSFKEAFTTLIMSKLSIELLPGSPIIHRSTCDVHFIALRCSIYRGESPSGSRREWVEVRGLLSGIGVMNRQPQCWNHSVGVAVWDLRCGSNNVENVDWVMDWGSRPRNQGTSSHLQGLRVFCSIPYCSKHYKERRKHLILR